MENLFLYFSRVKGFKPLQEISLQVIDNFIDELAVHFDPLDVLFGDALGDQGVLGLVVKGVVDIAFYGDSVLLGDLAEVVLVKGQVQVLYFALATLGFFEFLLQKRNDFVKNKFQTVFFLFVQRAPIQLIKKIGLENDLLRSGEFFFF